MSRIAGTIAQATWPQVAVSGTTRAIAAANTHVIKNVSSFEHHQKLLAYLFPHAVIATYEPTLPGFGRRQEQP